MFKVRCITVFGGRDHPPEEVADVLRKLKESVSGDATEVQMTRYTSTVVSDPDQKPEQALIDAARAFESTTSAAGVAPVSLGGIRALAGPDLYWYEAAGSPAENRRCY